MILEHKAIFGYLYGQPILSQHFFDRLPGDVQNRLARITQSKIIKKNRIIIECGGFPNIYVLQKGKAEKIYFNKINQKKIQKIIEEKEILGLAESIIDEQFRMRIKSVTDCHFNFIERYDFVSFIDKTPEICPLLLEVFSTNQNQKYKNFIHSTF
jgi:hypothetical protein